MHKALYRKWRPQVFEDVIGQDYIVTVLKNQVETGKIGHAYLFTGSRGTGKTSCAKIFAKAVNCENNLSGDPCLECEVCKSIGSNSAVDVVEIDAASHTGVDNIRDIIEESAFLPIMCKYRVYIIDEVHMLSISAFNALLKIMEEPPSHVIFILATTEVNQVPVTIISRCQRFDFSRIDSNLMVEHLLKIADSEKIELDTDAAETIARLADGGLRDALSIFDQCAGFDNHVTRDVVSKVSGQADREFIRQMAENIVKKNTADVLSLTYKAHKGSYSFTFIISELISIFRDTMIAKSVGIGNKELFTVGCDLDYTNSLASEMSLAQIMFCLDTMSETLNSLGKSANPNVLFEQCVIKMCNPNLSNDTDAILSRIEALERRLLSVPTDFSPFSAPTKKTENPKIEAPTETKKSTPTIDMVPNAFSAPIKKEEKKEISTPKVEEASAPEGMVPFDNWSNVLKIVSAKNTPLFGAIKASKAYIENDIVYIDTNDFSFGLLKSSEINKQTIKSAIASVMGKTMMVAQYKPKIAPISRSNAMDEILKRAERNGVDIHRE